MLSALIHDETHADFVKEKLSIIPQDRTHVKNTQTEIQEKPLPFDAI